MKIKNTNNLAHGKFCVNDMCKCITNIHLNAQPAGLLMTAIWIIVRAVLECDRSIAAADIDLWQTAADYFLSVVFARNAPL